jgi:TonB family protein
MPAVPAEVDVFSAGEIARAAGVDVRDVRAMFESGRLPVIGGRYLASREAADLVRSFRTGAALPEMEHALFQAGTSRQGERGVPLVGSAVVHTLMLGAFVFLLGVAPAVPRQPIRLDTTRLVFLPLPGEGGGGGGGGLKQPAPPPRATLAGTNTARSPVITRRVDKGPESKPRPAATPEPAPKPADPPPPETKPAPAPPVVAPVATVAADDRDRAGLPDATTTAPDSHGSGSDGGAGSGKGAGLGEGDGSGIGPGSGGGTGGGPYRPGSGITPPSLLREVKPDYTEDARLRGINGDVELEIVVRSDGSVGDVHLLRGLGAGLDQRAIDAVKKWRFAPARRFGTPVDVIVEVAVEFRIR